MGNRISTGPDYSYYSLFLCIIYRILTLIAILKSWGIGKENFITGLKSQDEIWTQWLLRYFLFCFAWYSLLSAAFNRLFDESMPFSETVEIP